MQKQVEQVQNGLKLTFSGAVKKQNIVTMVENCKSGQCDCMSDATKAKIETIAVGGSDNDVTIMLSGTVEQEEIERAMEKSPVLNP